MAWSGLDQRAFPRLSAHCDIAIQDRQFGSGLKTKTQNVGLGGVCVILDQGLEKLSQIRLRLVLNESQTPLECDGRVVWAVRSKEPRSGKVFYDTGIEFVNLSPEDKSRLEALLQTIS